MYLDFYGFREKPFNLTPDPRFVFLSKNHREAFAHLLYGINNRAGFIALTGEVGSGKTTVLRALLSQLDGDHHRTALIFNPCLSPPELLQSITREFGIPTCTSHSASLLEALNLFLLQQNAAGRTVVLVIDEAQNLEAAVLEQVRLISNLETDREKLIQIVLSGQPEFAHLLKREEMRQLSQRITVRYHLQPMDFQDTVDYINHRLEVAGGRGGVIFSRWALKRIYRYSRGLPRLINAACDRMLLAGYARDTARISFRIAEAGIKEMRKDTASDARKRSLRLIPTLVMLAVFLAVGIYYTRPDLIDRFNAWQRVGATQKQAEATGEQTKKDPVITGEELSRAMAAEFGKVSESESARRAFNTLAGFWNAPPVAENGHLRQVNGMEREALDRQLRLYNFSGNLGALLRLDSPAVLELTIPGIPGKRFLSLVGMENERLLVDPPLAGRRSLTFSELEKHWSGQGFLLWKDPLNLPAVISPGGEEGHIKRLQGLLREAGAYSRPLTGVYDDATISAVKKFQSSGGIKQDGIVGGKTLMLLYRSIDRFEVPRLTVGRK
jgi:general secretion pathway protein A